MRKRLCFAVAFLVLLLGAAYLVLWLTRTRHNITVEAYQQLALGMTEEQVAKIMGVPAGFYDGRTALPAGAWMSVDYLSMHAPAGGVLPDIKTRYWVGGDFAVDARFNEEGKLFHASVHAGPNRETLIRRVRRWLGL